MASKTNINSLVSITTSCIWSHVLNLRKWVPPGWYQRDSPLAFHLAIRSRFAGLLVLFISYTEMKNSSCNADAVFDLRSINPAGTFAEWNVPSPSSFYRLLPSLRQLRAVLTIIAQMKKSVLPIIAGMKPAKDHAHRFFRVPLDSW